MDVQERRAECCAKVAEAIAEFLKREGGYDNGFHTYVRGTVHALKVGELQWMTPPAHTQIRGPMSAQLYAKLQSILQDQQILSVRIDTVDIGYDCWVTEVKYIVEHNVTRVKL